MRKDEASKCSVKERSASHVIECATHLTTGWVPQGPGYLQNVQRTCLVPNGQQVLLICAHTVHTVDPEIQSSLNALISSYNYTDFTKCANSALTNAS